VFSDTPLPFAFLFGSPIGALAAAVGAVSVPIIIHLLNRRRFKVVTWAAMRFLLAAERKNTRRMRLEQIILLAVRCLLILLIVLAMASVMGWAESVWRWMFPENVQFMTLAGGRRTHKIVVVDGSFSMATKLGDGSAFDRARAKAKEVIGQSPRGDGFSVVLMGATARPVVPGSVASAPAEDAAKVAKEIDGLRLPHGNADLVATLKTIKDMLDKSPGKFQEREVYFLTDVQKSTWLLREPGTVAETLRNIQGRARTVFVDVGQDGVNNLAVTGLALGQPLATVGATTPVTVVVRNFGAEPREGVRLELWVGKARATREEQPMELRVAHQMVVKVGRGPNTFTFPYKFTAPGDYVLQARLDNDALELDDSRSAVVTVKNSVPVMLVDGKSAQRELLDRAAEWLKLALNPFDTGPAPGFAPFRPKVLTESQFADVGLGDLTDYDCVCFCDVARLSPPEVRRLETHLRRGGGAIFALGDQVDLGAYNEALYKSGQGLLPARLVQKQAARDRTWFQFKDADYTGPPLSAFGSLDDRASLESVRFRQYVRAVPADRGVPRRVLSFTPVAAPGPKAESLEGLPVGDPAVIEWQPPAPKEEGERGRRGEGEKKDGPGSPSPYLPLSPSRLRGRVVLYTSTANMDWTSWPASPSYLAFTQELMSYAVSGRLREQAVTVGDPLEEFLPPGGGALDATVTTPDRRTESTRTLSSEEANVLRWADTDVSGVYRVVLGQHPQEHVFAVNVPAATLDEQASESDLTRATREDLSRAYPEWEFQLVTDLNDVSHTGGPSASDAENRVAAPIGPGIAHYLLLAVLALVLVEVVMAWRFGHYSGTPSNEPVPSAGRWLPALAVGLAALAALLIGGSLLHYAVTGEFLGFLPEGLRRVFEGVNGIPAPAPGEGSHWRLESVPFLWDADADPWLIGLVAVLGTALVVLVYRQEGRTAGTAFRLVLVGLRVAMLLLVLVVMGPQLKLWFERQGFPDVVVLIDDSQSMSTVDQYQDADVKAAAAALAEQAGLREPDRLALAKALVTRPQGDWLTTLLTKRKAKVHVYHCSTRAHFGRIANVSEEEDLKGAAEAINKLSADPQNDSSQLGWAVHQVINDFRGLSLAAVVMLTDGVTTEGEHLDKVSKYAAEKRVPLFFVGLGDSREAKDLYLHDLQSEESVYVNDTLVFDVRLTGVGFGDLAVPVELREKGKDKVLDARTVKVDPSGKPVKVSLRHTPREEGGKVYELKVPVQEGEANPDNNVLERAVHVRKTKLIKVLYVEGEPRWEYRYVKSLLERESGRVEGNKSFDLKVLLLDADRDWPEQDKSAITEFPPKNELQQFDVVILGDFDPRKGPKWNENLQSVADFVKERGGGLLMIAGERYAPHAYKGTPLQDVLPIDLLTDRQPAEPAGGYTEPYRPELTPAGRMHPIFRFNTNDERENDEVWNGLQQFYWYSEGYAAKRAAEVLATHPRLRRADGKGAPSKVANAGLDGHPLVVQQFVGSGRSLFFGVNETWRWRWREDEQRFNQFWVQTVRYLARSRTGRIELRLDKQTPYRRGEPIRVTVRFPDDAPPPPPETEVKVVVERRPPKAAGAGDVDVQTVSLAKVEGSRSNFEALLTRTPEGDYQFWLTSPSVQGPRPKAECKVLAPPGEMEVLRMNQAEMERAAEETHGRFYTLADADQLLTDLPSGTRVTLNASGPPMPLWNELWVFALALGFLTLEWVLRKRKNLL
jgi:hypothetical protein